MARYLIQSAIDFQFLHASPVTGEVSWTPSLATAIRFGTVSEADQVAELMADHCDHGAALVVDLDADV